MDHRARMDVYRVGAEHEEEEKRKKEEEKRKKRREKRIKSYLKCRDYEPWTGLDAWPEMEEQDLEKQQELCDDCVPLFNPSYDEETNPNPCDPKPDVTWFITATQLNILWNIVFPRIVALYWSGEALSTPKDPEFIQKNIRKLLNQSSKTGRKQGYPNRRDPDYLKKVARQPFKGLTKEFIQHAAALEYYLLYGTTIKGTHIDPIPITFLDGYGFNFLLSNEGIELLMPPNPMIYPKSMTKAHNKIAEVYRKYTYRGVGSAPLLIPTSSCNPDDTPGGLAATASRVATSGGLASGIRIRADEALNWYFRKTVQNVLVAHGYTYPDDLHELVSLLEDLCHDPQDLETALLCRFRTVLRCLLCEPIDLPVYVFLRGPTRCWQIPGSLYGRIMQAHPRIVATIWYEQHWNKTDPPTLNDMADGSYEDRYNNPGDDGLRTVFEERLEIHLPKERRMKFRTSPPSEPALRNEIIIDNFGFTFPCLCPAPSMKQMYQAWITGNASNPVFTDTMDTQ